MQHLYLRVITWLRGLSGNAIDTGSAALSRAQRVEKEEEKGGGGG